MPCEIDMTEGTFSLILNETKLFIQDTANGSLLILNGETLDLTPFALKRLAWWLGEDKNRFTDEQQDTNN